MIQVNGITMGVSHMFAYQIINNMTKKNKLCWATNETLAGYLGLSKSRVSHIITDLHRAGWVALSVIYDKTTHMYGARKMIALPKFCLESERPDAMKKLEQDNSEKGIRARLVNNGVKTGINAYLVVDNITKYGAKRVEEAICIVRASNQTNNPSAYFLAALSKDYEVGVRAKRLIGKFFTVNKVIPKLLSIAAVAKKVQQEVNHDITKSKFFSKLPVAVQEDIRRKQK